MSGGKHGVFGCREVNVLFYRRQIFLRHLHLLPMHAFAAEREKKDETCWADRNSVTANSFSPFGQRARRVSLATTSGSSFFLVP